MSSPTISGLSSPRRGSSVRAGSSEGLAVVVLVSVILVFYYGLWLPGLILMKRDAYGFFPQIKHYAAERLMAGELPQWFPYEGLGRAFLGATTTGVFHPFTALYFFLLSHEAYRASTLLSCLLAAFGAYALGRKLDFSRTGALLAGIAFTLSGYVVSLTDNIPYLYSICVLPLFCAALEKALLDNRSWMAAPATIWASVILNGDIQAGYYYIFIALAWMVTRAPYSRLDACFQMALIGGLAALLAGIQLGPAWAVFVGSERAQPAQFLEHALEWSTHPLRLLTVLVSPVGEDVNPVTIARSFFGTPSGGLWAESLYFGVPVTGLAILGALQRRDLRVLVLLGSLALFLALGRWGGLYEIFYHTIPLWSAFRYPEKFMGVVSFAAAMLAGAGLDALRTEQRYPLHWLTAALLLASVGGGLRTEAATAWVVTNFGVSETLSRAIMGSAAQAFLFSAVAALGVTILVAGIQRRAFRPELLLAALVALTTLDLSRANLATYHTGPVEASTFTPPLAEALQAREGTLAPGRFRLVSIQEKLLVWPKELMAPLGYYGAGSVARRQALAVAHNAQFRLETVLPYMPGYSVEFAETLHPETGIEAAARFNVTYYIGGRFHLDDPRLSKMLVTTLPPYDLALFRNPIPAKPRAYLSRHPEPAASPVDPVVLFARPDFLKGEVDVIETSDQSLPGPALEQGARIEQYTPEEVRVGVATPQPAVLILLDTFENGWKAWLADGHELPILRANALVRAVVVPPGAHDITFRYETPLLKAGALASLAGLVICMLLLIHVRDGATHPGDQG